MAVSVCLASNRMIGRSREFTPWSDYIRNLRTHSTEPALLGDLKTKIYLYHRHIPMTDVYVYIHLLLQVHCITRQIHIKCTTQTSVRFIFNCPNIPSFPDLRKIN